MLIHLFHGRTDPYEQLDDWGSDGPILRIDGFHVTYLEHFRVKLPTDDAWMDLDLEQGLIYYDGVYYGDFSVMEDGRAGGADQVFEWYDPMKTRNRGG